MPQTTIYLPTRRAARTLREAFLEESGGEAMLLPRILALGHADEDEALILDADRFEDADTSLGRPAIEPTARLMALMRMILAWAKGAGRAGPAGLQGPLPMTAAQAAALAADLANLMDMAESEEADLGALETLVPDDLAAHWAETVAFLTILTEQWPAFLREAGLVSPVGRRNALMAQETERLAGGSPHSVIAAGSTGTVPATARLLQTIAHLPNGAVVLPGLDLALDAESWETLRHHPEHPQAGMAELLKKLGATREDVALVPGSAPGDPERARLRLVSETLRPAETTDRWRQAFDGAPERPAAELAVALEGLSLVEAPTAHDEAEVIALILRDCIEHPGKTAALVTPDRELARRVAARLNDYGLAIDDSAGTPIRRTLPGAFLDLVLSAVESDFAPPDLMALLKHPLTRLARPAGEIRRIARVLERALFREDYLGGGLSGAAEALQALSPKTPATPAERADIAWLVAALQSAFAPLVAVFGDDAGHGAAALVQAHAAAAEALARDETGAVPLWGGDAGEALSVLLSRLIEEGGGLQLSARSYPAVYRTLLAGQAVRPRRPAHPRLSIWGQLEARLQQPDLMVLGGLNEGSWPKPQDSGPWLNRAMREKLGLSPPERRIGLAAHDFAQALGAKSVVLSRALKVEGVPTVPSRWLQRLQTLVDAAGPDDGLEASEDWVAWARDRDTIEAFAPAKPPRPCPPVTARPRGLSVTQIERWIANPYEIYARHILKLVPLTPLGTAPDAAMRGSAFHRILNRFTKAYPDSLPDDVEAVLKEMGEALFDTLGDDPSLLAFWRPSFERFAEWFAATEPGRRANIVRSLPEVPGALTLPSGFRLTARADRIDEAADGSLVIYDYKTGAPPSASHVTDLYKPQMPLEALIAQEGGFEALGPRSVSGLVYIHASGRGDGGEQQDASKDRPTRSRARGRKARGADRSFRQARHALRGQAPGERGLYVRVPVRRLRAPGPRARMADRRRAVMTAPAELVQTADANQTRAAEPQASVWVSANAGTGKTAVLVKRILRLLMAGADPESILCLTYTKTAAAEMQNRLLKTLSGWALMPEAELEERLAPLLQDTVREKDRQTARRLFARVLEARGGLKIHTIHGFCERLLQRFPLEAAVTPNFSVFDEPSADAARNDAFDAVAVEAVATPDSPLGHALSKAVALTSEEQFRQVVGEILAKRAELARIVRRHAELGQPTDWPRAEAEALKTFFGVAEKNEATLVAEQASVLSDAQIDAALAALSEFATTKTDKGVEETLRRARRLAGHGRTGLFKTLFLTQKGEPRARLVTKGIADAAPEIAVMLDAAKISFARIETDLAHLRVVEATGAVLTFADAVQTAYDAQKRREAALDYDDLIVKTLDLLSRSNAAAWVLYKIDGGVDHILIDEAQDTNPEQWSIVEALAEEFFAGAGARAQPRTLFAVGDEKQSIYSFQGANPVRFGETGRRFRAAARAAETAWHDVPLNVSFRSTVPVLEAVDRVFAQDDAARGLTFLEGTAIQHYAARQGQAGLVELWEVEETDRPADSAPFEPWNEDESGADALEALCGRLSAQIRHWLDTREVLESRDRPIRAGDILILVRRRAPFTAPMIRALKRAGIPVAGADRMRLLEQLAVQDLMALADVLLMPEDDLALAVVLKSPLFGLDETALFDLAHERDGSLWSALQAKARSDSRYAEAATDLRALLGRADMLPPYEFFAALLGERNMRMRKRMLSRLGPEAAEAIDEFLDAALSYEREAAPSLQGFIAALREGSIDVKRDMDQDRDEVRIMTVHGAKGLQAPIVIMPDTCSVPRGQGPQIYRAPRADSVADDAHHLFWPPAGHSGVPGLSDAKSAVARAEQEEYRRLLYVAMTRAEDRLYVCGWQGVQKRNDACWYDLIEQGLRPHLVPMKDAQGRAVFRMSSPQEAPAQKDKDAPAMRTAAPLPDWARKPAPQERVGTRLSPSRLAQNATGESPFGAEQAPLGPGALAEDMRFVRGRLIHALLQHLPQVPPEDRPRAADAFVTARGEMLAPAARQQIVAESLAIVGDPRFAPLFAPSSLAEVPVVARIGEGGTAIDLEGQIDRLAILEDGLLILDYKTNRPPPTSETDVAPAYIGQLAAYRLALRTMFPEKPVRAALLWTDGPHLMEISSALLESAERDILRAGGALDAHEGRT
ncbi:hypothetical protein AUC68_01450 [Methyloceanibacter methanicus]|uniref:DNA 3'-5' helicase n=1 Tax=Methyloceanibacter methanicus TaxID=1774968 RepID=A0A1E3W209_9HYPH|nr:hypothetical protein AUC68_01450 [Methyloceanibacter methanicus]